MTTEQMNNSSIQIYNPADRQIGNIDEVLRFKTRHE